MQLFRLSTEYFTGHSEEKERYIISLKDETHQQNIEVSKDEFSELLKTLSKKKKIRSRYSKNIHKDFFIVYHILK